MPLSSIYSINFWRTLKKINFKTLGTNYFKLILTLILLTEDLVNSTQATPTALNSISAFCSLYEYALDSRLTLPLFWDAAFAL